jgi:hypothetical protein
MTLVLGKRFCRENRAMFLGEIDQDMSEQEIRSCPRFRASCDECNILGSPRFFYADLTVCCQCSGFFCPGCCMGVTTGKHPTPNFESARTRDKSPGRKEKFMCVRCWPLQHLFRTMACSDCGDIVTIFIGENMKQLTENDGLASLMIYFPDENQANIKEAIERINRQYAVYAERMDQCELCDQWLCGDCQIDHPCKGPVGSPEIKKDCQETEESRWSAKSEMDPMDLFCSEEMSPEY